jgi:hypothetical protein
MKRGAVVCVKYCGTIMKENNYSIKCKIPLNFVKKNAIRNQKENEFRI